jgi:hypothetical protein
MMLFAVQSLKKTFGMVPYQKRSGVPMRDVLLVHEMETLGDRACQDWSGLPMPLIR